VAEKLIGRFLYLFAGVFLVTFALANLQLACTFAMSDQVDPVLRLPTDPIHITGSYFRLAVKEVTTKVLKMILAEFVEGKR
jgi:hypothetical protein